MISINKFDDYVAALSTDDLTAFEGAENGLRVIIMDTGARYICDKENNCWRNMETGEIAVQINKPFEVKIEGPHSDAQNGIYLVGNKVFGNLMDNDGSYFLTLKVSADVEGATVTANGAAAENGVVNVAMPADRVEIVVSKEGYTTVTKVLDLGGVFMQPVETSDEASSTVGSAVVGTAVVHA